MARVWRRPACAALPPSLFQLGWFQAQRLLHRGYAWARVWMQPLPGPDPPERLLKASLPVALYSVRSERAFCRELEYNLLFRWFLDMDLMDHSFDAAIFTKH